MINIMAHELDFVLFLFSALPLWGRLTANWALEKLFVPLICLRVPARERESVPGENEITSHPRGGCQHSRSWSCCPLAVHWQLQPTIVFSASTGCLGNDSLTALVMSPSRAPCYFHLLFFFSGFQIFLFLFNLLTHMYG